MGTTTIGRRLLVLVASAAVGLSACGGGVDAQADPRGALEQAVATLGEWSGATATFRVESDEASLLALAEGDVTMTPELAQTVLDSFIRVSALQGEDPASTDDDEFVLHARIGGHDGLEVRSVDGRMFVRSQLRALLAEIDPSGAAVADLEESLAGARSAGLDFLDAAADGAWLELVGLEQLLSMVQGMSGMASPDPEAAEAAASSIGAALQRFLRQDVEVTHVGGDDAGERLRLTAPGTALLDLAEEIVTAAGPLAGRPALPGADPAAMLDELRAEIGAEADSFELPIDVWIDGGTVTRVGVDVVAFMAANPELAAGDELPPGVERLLLVADLERFDGGVDVPADPIEVDLFELAGRMMSGFTGGFAPTDG